MKPLQQSQLVPQGGGEAIPLVREHLVLGRRESCDVCLKFPNISGRHCELTLKNGAWIITDLGSTNGIKVNGERITNKKLLHSGDVLTIGKRNYVLHYEEVVSQSINELMEDMEEDVMSIPLLERAGLQKPGSKTPLFKLDEEDEEDDDD